MPDAVAPTSYVALDRTGFSRHSRITPAESDGNHPRPDPLGSQTVMQVYDAAAKVALVHQLELGMDAGGKCALATAH